MLAFQTVPSQLNTFTAEGKESAIAEGVSSNDLAINSRGEIYFTDPQNKRVWFIDAKGNKRVAHEGILFPNGVRFSPDCVGGYCAPDKPYKVYVGGQPFTGDASTIVLTNLKEIAIVIGTPPAQVPSKFPGT